MARAGTARAKPKHKAPARRKTGRPHPTPPPPQPQPAAPRQDDASPPVPDDDAPPPHPLGRVLAPAQFWALMERWKVPDAVALALIGYPGKIGASGKRPRFRFTTRQQRITSYLPEIDAALAALGQTPAWLHRKNRTAPFGGRTPLELMLAGECAAVLRFLNRAVLRTALAG